MTACPTTAPTMTSRVIKRNLHVNSELAEQLDPMELSSLNELLDRIAAMGVATDYDQIGPKTDLREINSPHAIHHVAVVEEQCSDSSSILRTSYVRIPDPSMSDSRGGTDVHQTLNLKSGSWRDSLDNTQKSKLQGLETFRPLSLRLDGVPNPKTPAHPIISDLSQIRKRREGTIHHY